ncbi:hypothetical protein JCGZ_09986 [Jatropha curcas]|uniref:Uncharacterized protein n=1 Tax=Jatropha curcas TaxID=180498 RepID=A0A067KUR3_JATCU|nr:hypothetical protein JCGZ_09986 [Jatropha curcas]
MHSWTRSLSKVEKINLGRGPFRRPRPDETEDAGFGFLLISWFLVQPGPRLWGFAPLPHGSANGGYGLHWWHCAGRDYLDRAALGFDDWIVSPIILQADANNEVGTDEEIVLAPRTGEGGARDDSEDVAPRRRWDT